MEAPLLRYQSLALDQIQCSISFPCHSQILSFPSRDLCFLATVFPLIAQNGGTHFPKLGVVHMWSNS
ncbi:hypothetical protein RchiOBHm_Chr2g0167791 [Rosa chinensis]|uniref:Uncharacterized protein n=1 Tax=Rosa chinensis TaxID=74649 RepID=A0A2P6S4G5_ROSCH|nr:hypothetical protein RchiOBHm_Chr2g0167791 [Rosa chinensis]